MKTPNTQHPTFYTMLYIKNNNPANNMAENGNVNYLGYINCCSILSKSLERFGHQLIVITNEPDIILSNCSSLNVERAFFGLDIPEGIRFFGAHHKIDVFKHLSLYGSEYSILLDSDVVCINRMPENIRNIIAQKIPMYLGTSDRAYTTNGTKKVVEDKAKLMGKLSFGIWAGGEFLGGDKQFFHNIYSYCIKYWDRYVYYHGELFHNGDEMLTSCAIEDYFITNNKIFDVGTVNCIYRSHSIPTVYIERPFDVILDNFLLHLPADKEYLAKYTYSYNFINEYKKYVKIKNRKKIKIIVFIKRCVKKILKIFVLLKNGT
jgi:hypothetical protein